MPEQPIPGVSNANVERVVRRDYATDRIPEALEILTEYGHSAERAERPGQISHRTVVFRGGDAVALAIYRVTGAAADIATTALLVAPEAAIPVTPILPRRLRTAAQRTPPHSRCLRARTSAS
ncbi:MAG: hypothetical protein ACKVX7_15755 [Planctomycetota bacterium]